MMADMRRSLMAVFVAVSLAAACTSETPQDKDTLSLSPYAGWVPGCPDGLTESHPSTYTQRPGGFYAAYNVQSITVRICFSTDGKERTDMTVFEFSNDIDAGAFMADGRTRGTSGLEASWRPPQRHDEFSRRSFDSALKECADVGRIADAQCKVSDFLDARVGRTVLQVGTGAEGHIYVPPSISCGARPSNPRDQSRWEQCIELAAVGPQVVGDPRQTQNETTMGEMLGRSSR